MTRLTVLWTLLSVLFHHGMICAAQNDATWPLHNDTLNSVVEWDHYSLMINGQRLYVWSGEIHYWRIPIPELWTDILQKIKAAGFNTFALYSHWGYHNPRPGVLDFESGAHNFTRLFDLAKDLGMYVLFRPGPYVNAESNAGAFPLWVTTGAYGELRNNDTRYTAAWKPFWEEIGSIVAPYQITNGGNVITYQIENELGEQWIGDPEDKIPDVSAVQYMEDLEATARAQGINIPFQANDPNLNTFSWSKDFYDGYGSVDLYGLDSYPACWTCNLTECNSVNGAYQPFKVVDYYSHFEEISPTQPNFLPEFQGGSFNPWGGPEGGCPENSPPDFANLFYRNNVGQRVTAMSLYMLFGGTNWGYLAAPVVATSYDYSAPISENRMIWDKYSETKLVGLFLRAAKDLTMTNRIGTNQSDTTNPAVVFSELRNPETNAAFYVTIHRNSSLGTTEAFKVPINTSIGALTIPQYGSSVLLNGHQSKMIVSDFSFGNHSLLYSTAEVLSTTVVDGRDILALWMPTGETSEFVVKSAASAAITTGQDSSSVTFHNMNDSTGVTITQEEGMSVLKFDDGLTVLIMDRSAAYKFYAPVLSANPHAYANETVFVQGPNLVRGASYSADETTLSLTGDNNGTATMLIVFARKSTEIVEWNGEQIAMVSSDDGSLRGTIAGPSQDSIVLPIISGWKAEDSLPERLPSYNDSHWVQADHMSTPNPYPPRTLPVLYVDEYGYHVGTHLWRGRFTGLASGVFLNVTGGRAFGWSAYLNGDFIGSYLGTAYDSTGMMELTFANATVHDTNGPENILLVIQDNHGHDETTGATIPRGISNATLISASNSNPLFTSWKVQGTAGGEANIDPIRGVYSEGGLYGERAGWHLPNFNDTTWTSSNPSESPSSPRVTFYRTTIPLSIPTGLDAAISFILTATPNPSAPLRALLFVNGYQYGQFNPYIGHQTEFPVPPGILNYDGDNTIALSVWRQIADAGGVDVDWKITGLFASSFDPRFDAEYLRPGWTEERLQYT